MTYLIFILITLVLLVGFFALTSYENRRGARAIAPLRARLDQQVERGEFIMANVDLSAFARDEIRRVVGIVGHAMAHLSLQAVRTIERLLTRLVRRLRPSYTVDAMPRESTRAFVKTLSDFKGRLKETRPVRDSLLNADSGFEPRVSNGTRPEISAPTSRQP